MAIENNSIKGAHTRNQGTPAQSVPARKIGSHTSYATPNYTNSLSEGQIIRGEITDLRNHEVTITLSDNTTIIAQTSDNSSLYIGQTATFKVTNISPQVINIERLAAKYSDGQIATILKALEEADLQKNERNMQLVRSLLDYQMPINKPMLSSLIQQMATHPDVSTEALVLMNKHNIPVTKENVLQFENIINKEATLLNNIENVSDELPTLLGTLAESAPSHLVKEFGGNLLNIINQHIKSSDTPSQNLNLSYLSDSERTLLANALSESNPEVSAKLINNTATLDDVRFLLASGEFTFSEEIYSANTASLNDIVSKLSFAEKYMAYNNQELSHITEPAMRESLSDKLAFLNLPESVINSVKDGTSQIGSLLSTITDALNALPESFSGNVSELFASEEFMHLFKHSLKHLWTLSPKQLAAGETSVNDYYNNLLQDLKQTTALINSNLSGQGSESITAKTSHMQETLGFMEQINSLFSYVQLPIRLQEQITNSDLYVYTKKDELKNHPDRISVLLHLDMDHLGSIDIHVEKKNNRIDSTFYCNNDENAALFRNNISLLSDTLNEMGYLFNASITNKEKDTDIVKDFIESKSGTVSVTDNAQIKRYNFDIRA